MNNIIVATFASRSDAILSFVTLGINRVGTTTTPNVFIVPGGTQLFTLMQLQLGIKRVSHHEAEKFDLNMDVTPYYGYKALYSDGYNYFSLAVSPWEQYYEPHKFVEVNSEAAKFGYYLMSFSDLDNALSYVNKIKLAWEGISLGARRVIHICACTMVCPHRMFKVLHTGVLAKVQTSDNVNREALLSQPMFPVPPGTVGSSFVRIDAKVQVV